MTRHPHTRVYIYYYTFIFTFLHRMKMGSLRAAVLKIGVLATLQPSDTAVILSLLSLLGVCQEDQPNMPCRKTKVGGHRISNRYIS